MAENRLALDGAINNLTQRDIFFRIWSTQNWNGSELPMAEKTLTCLWTGDGPEGEPKPDLCGYLSMHMTEIGRLNGFFTLVLPPDGTIWSELRREQQALAGWTVRGVPLPDKSNAREFYVVSRQVALVLCREYDHEDLLTNILVPVRDAEHDDDPIENAFHGFLTGPWLLKGLKDGLPLN